MIAQEALNLLEWPRLCQHLATFASTKLGVSAARDLEIPATQEETLELLAQTEEIIKIKAQLVSWSLDGIEDLSSYLQRAQLGGMLQGKELLEVASTLGTMRRLRRQIEELEEIPVLKEKVAELRTYPEIEQEIYHCIDDRGEVTDRAAPKLAGIRSQIKGVREKIYQVLQSIVQRQSNALQENVITQRGDRFVLPVKASHKEQIPGIVHDTSSTGVTFYIEPNGIIPLGNKLKQLRRQEQAEIEIILKGISNKIGEAYTDLSHLLAIATLIDLATARANYSLWLEGNHPRFIDWQKGDSVTLRQLKHPLLIWQHQHEQGGPVVPIDIQIKPQIRVVAITGPNTGGKTVTLKTLGLAALMAKVGLYIPAREPVEIPWFEQILADIGDEQSIEQSLSTFSGHIRRIIRILEAVGTRESLGPVLVLLDELGAGTDPAEGSALAIALLRYLADTVQLTIATTHYGELKALKYQDQRFENASVEFDEVSLSPTYRLLWGIPGRSNALMIARRLGLDEKIIAEAQTLTGGYSQEINQVIAGLEAQRKEQEQKAKQASQLLAQTERFYEEISNKAADLQAREKALKLSQEQAIQEAIATAKAEIAQVIRTLQQGPQTAQNAQKATTALAEIAQKRLPERQPPKVSEYVPQIGERVKLPSLGQTAEVLSNPDEEGELTVRFGVMKMTVNLRDLESLDGRQIKQPTPAVKSVPKVAPTPAKLTVQTSVNTIDIRGSRVADAETILDKAISEANNYVVLWIIHGKGTGKLKEGVHSFLKQHPLVERFELAPANQGGAGVTIAYLKD